MSIDELIAGRFTSKDSTKSRKALVTSALLTIIVSSIVIVSDQISLLGFTIKVEQQSLIAFGQITTLLLLIVFLFRVFPEYIPLFREYSLKKVELEEQASRSAIFEDHFGYDDGDQDYDGSPEAELREVGARAKRQKAAKETAFDKFELRYNVASGIVLDLALPVFLSFIAVFSPEAPKRTALYLFSDTSNSSPSVEVIVDHEDS